MQIDASLVTGHFQKDVVYQLPFILGQMLYMLRRSGIAIRSKINPMSSRKEYFKQNWDMLLYRGALGLGLVYWPFRHYDVGAWIQQVSHGILPLDLPQVPMVFFLLGIVSDSILDWISTWKRIPVLNLPMPSWLKETIPLVTDEQKKILTANATLVISSSERDKTRRTDPPPTQQ